MGIKLTNNAFGTLAAGINSSVTSITLTSGQGARFPTLGAGDYFYATLIDTSNNLEIVKCTARSTDVLTVVRGQESTTARAYSTGDRIEIRLTAQTFFDATLIPDGDKGDITTSSSGTVWTIDNSAVTAAKLAAGAARTNFGAGAILQVVQTVKTNTFSSSASSFTDVTGLTATITPASTSSRILVMASVAVGINPSYFLQIRLARGGSAILQGDAAGSRLRTQGMVYMYNQTNNAQLTWPGYVVDSPASTSALTYSVQMMQLDSSTHYVNRLTRDDDASYEPRSASSIILMEIAG